MRAKRESSLCLSTCYSTSITTAQTEILNTDNLHCINCLYINDFNPKSCYGLMQQAYSMPSIVMNGEQIVSTGQKWCIQV